MIIPQPISLASSVSGGGGGWSTIDLKNAWPLLPPCSRVWTHYLSAGSDGASCLRDETTPSFPFCKPTIPPPPLWLGQPHKGGVEFNKACLNHMLKRYANVQVFLLFNVLPHTHTHTRVQSNWLLFSLSQNQTQGESLAVCFWEEWIILLGLLLGIWSEKLLRWLRLELITLRATGTENEVFLVERAIINTHAHTYPIISGEQEDEINSATKLVTLRPSVIQ